MASLASIQYTYVGFDFSTQKLEIWSWTARRTVQTAKACGHVVTGDADPSVDQERITAGLQKADLALSIAALYAEPGFRTLRS